MQQVEGGRGEGGICRALFTQQAAVLIEKPSALQGGTPASKSWCDVMCQEKPQRGRGLSSLYGVGQSCHIFLGPLPHGAHGILEGVSLV